MKEQTKNTFYYDIDIPIKEEIIKKVLSKKISNNNNSKKIKPNTKKELRIIIIGLFILFLFIFIGCLFKIINWYQDNNKTNKAIKEIDTITEVIEITEEENTELINEEKEAPESDYWHYIKTPLIQVDFNELIKKNSDTIAWIQVNNTNINYPIVQTNNNDYYLTHSYDKSYNEAGWVFMDYRNNQDFNNRNTIIYAHSRLDKTMFGSLSKVLKQDWYNNKDNHIIKISTKTENSLWQIFSVYKIKAESYYITTDFKDDNTYIEFLTTLKNRSKHNFNVSLNSNDSIITLSTCYSDTERTVVHAKKIKKSERTS